MSSANASTLYSAIWLELVKIQRKTRLMGLVQDNRPEALLSQTEGLILHILEDRPECNVKELSETLNLERSWVSRIVSSLQEAKLVRTFVPEADKRSKKLRLRSGAGEALRRLNAFRAGIMEKLLTGLDKSEQRELCDLCRMLANGLLAPAHLAVRDAHPLDNEFARISWAVGVLGDDFMHSGLNVNQYQVLYAMSQAQDQTIFAADLLAVLPFDMSTISRTLAAFAAQGLIERKKLSQDRRALTLRLSDKGRALWDKCLRIADAALGQALRDMPGRQAERLLALLKLAGGEAMRRPHVGSAPRVQIIDAESTDLGLKAQAFVDKQTQLKRTPSASGRNLSRRSVLLIDGEVKGVADVLQRDTENQSGRLFLVTDDVSRSDCQDFVQRCLRERA